MQQAQNTQQALSSRVVHLETELKAGLAREFPLELQGRNRSERVIKKGDRQKSVGRKDGNSSKHRKKPERERERERGTGWMGLRPEAGWRACRHFKPRANQSEVGKPHSTRAY